MAGVVLMVPGALDTKTGGYVYDRHIVEGLRDRGWAIKVLETSGTPAPDLLARLPDGTVVLADGLSFGMMPDEAAAHAPRLRFVALVHHPLAEETGLSESDAALLRESERRALRSARAVVVTSTGTARMLAAFDVPEERITVIVPGTEPAPVAQGSGGPGVELLCVASIIPRKGHAVLLRALKGVEHPWHLTCVGGERHRDTMRELRDLANESGTTARVTFAGELAGDDLAARYDAADVFVLPTLYEGYGMVVADALARGLPVVASRTGGIPELVGDDAGILVEPGDVRGLRAALRRVMDRETRARLAAGARARRHALPTWEQAVDKMAAVLHRVAR